MTDRGALVLQHVEDRTSKLACEPVGKHVINIYALLVLNFAVDGKVRAQD